MAELEGGSARAGNRGQLCGGRNEPDFRGAGLPPRLLECTGRTFIGQKTGP
jgi:hypothetical protein